ncbi:MULTISPECIES: putative lipid II flippase FtsW [unclassified Aeromicrobium]|uniref:putative lipid II flippase FtsW n=1 Tax=unclassified Aeromicrobium TaxID=2633570 RepID=UPI0006F4B37D|nr:MULTISPECIES: putative lipid II flippase FtsW [unclassified Aeromicrobium]KQO37438.1 cell division protein FtsW [Aeromicrobium sp. Leaf245]KQP84992.1 cell division protein FtsW [Aeromicrobium sp. Leaf291]RYY46550.1 MAG: putative lipid II flippase FtsW [Actinomycetales bacterium]KQP26296.1 cell division protein FtsW [Aeromicrobium sp. Leaf272]MCR4512250.1 putative lipid II flippase FtsW [Aeromicrobium sp. 50.2.37]
MSTTDRRPAPGAGAGGPMSGAQRLLDRPLASYQLVLGTTALLLGLGLIMVLSASSVLSLQVYGNSFAIVQRQLVLAVVGLVGAYLVTRLPLATLRKLILPGLVVSIGLTLATFIPGVGVEVNGNTNWIPVAAGFRLQPSEFLKLALVLWIADHYARRQKHLDTPRLILLPMLIVAGACAALVVAQNDLGTALVLFAVIVGMLWVAGLPGRYLGAIVAFVGVLCVFFVATAPHRVARMLSFLNPLADPDKDGYQAVHAMMGFARGGFGGVGLGGSRQKWGSLPEAHTDFILAVVGEELGLLGSLVVLVLFVLLAVAGVRIATRSRDPFARYAAAGITVWITAQAMINIAMVLGLLPVIGIPLPLLSYGGSSVLVTLVGCGVLLSCATTEPGAKRALAASKARRARRNAARRR